MEGAHVLQFASDPLPEVEALEGLVVLGGRQNAYDPALKPVGDLLKEATAAGLPTLGVCLGAQLLATSHGGRVEVSAPAGPERGIIDIRTRPGAEADPVIGGVVDALGRAFPAVSMHNDAVTELPKQATWLASSKQYPYQAFRVGSALGVQFHPEMDPQTYGQWMTRETDLTEPAAQAQWNARGEELNTLARQIARGLVNQ